MDREGEKLGRGEVGNMVRFGKGRSVGKGEDCEGNGKVERERQKYGLGNYKRDREGRAGKMKEGK